ncbi:XkdX family protein [Bacillaceae bacterium SAOS 7]|nr:XkdX family protein [Bacillaceae bacterium SAOS 7]
MWYLTVKRFYDGGHPSYTDESIKIFVSANMITTEQYQAITSKAYTV